MKLSSHFVESCRRSFERWRQEVWPELLFGLGMVLFGICCFAWTAWEWRSPKRIDIEMVLVGGIMLPVGLWFSYEALQSCVAHLREFFASTHKLPAERRLELNYATLSARLRCAAAHEADGSWQEGEDFCIWKRSNGAALFVHQCGEGRYVLLFRCRGDRTVGTGRLKGWCANEGLKFPTRFKRVKVEGCVFYCGGRVAVYPAEAVQAFETELLPHLLPATRQTTP